MDEVEEAVSLADQSFIELQSISHIKRADFLAEIANEIELLGKELIDCFTAESGFNHERAESERKRTINQLRAFSDLVRKNEWIEASIDLSDNLSQPPKPDLRKMYFGIGPVVVFGASNFPLAYSTAGGDTVAAFAAGCPVIVKSHPMHAGGAGLATGKAASGPDSEHGDNGLAHGSPSCWIMMIGAGDFSGKSCGCCQRPEPRRLPQRHKQRIAEHHQEAAVAQFPRLVERI